MTEPATVATVTAQITMGTLSAAIAGAIGVDVPTIAWALVAGFFGSASEARVGPTMRVVQYVAACLLAALGATVVMHQLHVTDDSVRYMLAACLSAGFYLLKKMLMARFLKLADRWLGRIERVFGEDDK